MNSRHMTRNEFAGFLVILLAALGIHTVSAQSAPPSGSPAASPSGSPGIVLSGMVLKKDIDYLEGKIAEAEKEENERETGIKALKEALALEEKATHRGGRFNHEIHHRKLESERATIRIEEARLAKLRFATRKGRTHLEASRTRLRIDDENLRRHTEELNELTKKLPKVLEDASTDTGDDDPDDDIDD